MSNDLTSLTELPVQSSAYLLSPTGLRCPSCRSTPFNSDISLFAGRIIGRLVGHGIHTARSRSTTLLVSRMARPERDMPCLSFGLPLARLNFDMALNRLSRTRIDSSIGSAETGPTLIHASSSRGRPRQMSSEPPHNQE